MRCSFLRWFVTWLVPGNLWLNSKPLSPQLRLKPTEEVVEVIEEQLTVSTPTPEPTEEVGLGALTAQEAYDLALPEALAWQADATLASLSTSLGGPLDAEGKSESWELKFWSPSAGEVNNLTFDYGVLHNLGPLAMDLTPVPAMDSVILDTKRIYDIAAAAGGSKFIDEGNYVDASLGHYPGDDSLPTWVVNYFAQDNTASFTVAIDARNGEVIATAE